jgi:hypothetical protein
VSGAPRAGVARVEGGNTDARFSAIEYLGTQARLTLQVTPGVNYILDASTNLLNWWPIGTNNAGTNNLQVLDPDVSGYKSKFYRVRRTGF